MPLQRKPRWQADRTGAPAPACCRNTDHAAAHVRAACLKSLAALRLPYLDLYLM